LVESSRLKAQSKKAESSLPPEALAQEGRQKEKHENQI
jgi:hypothetical protein